MTVLAPNAIAAVALAHGFVIMTFAYAFSKDSGSYINPAVTLSVVVAGELTVVEAIPIILAELLGGIMGALLLLTIYGHAAPNHLGATLINIGVYFAAQAAGAVLAGLLYRFVWKGNLQKDRAATAMPAAINIL